MAAPNRLTLLVRAYCHLCDEMREGLRTLQVPDALVIDEVDVDTDAALEAAWGEKVPVLLAGDRELCHYRLDRDAVARYFTRHAVNAGES